MGVTLPEQMFDHASAPARHADDVRQAPQYAGQDARAVGSGQEQLLDPAGSAKQPQQA